MKKRITTLAFLTIGLSATFAQSAKAILDKLATESKTYKTMQGTFEYKLENKEANVYENSEGTFFIKGDKYFVDILGTETYFDGTDSYSFIKEVDEVSIQKPEEDDEDFLKPSNLFTIYQKGYTYSYVGKLVEKGKSIHIIDLLPKKANANYKKLVVKIDVKTNKLVSMQSVGKQGDDVTILITSMKTDTPIKDSKFTFNKSAHPEVEVIDMR